MELLKVTDLHTSFFTPAGEVKAVNGLNFSLEKGKVLGIVGESGSGKSVTAYSILQILANPGKIVSGSIVYRGQELVGASKEEMSKIRGNKISIIFPGSYDQFESGLHHRQPADGGDYVAHQS